MASKNNQNGKQPVIAYFSTYPPRECGIATFTCDLVSAMDRRFNPAIKTCVAAINENPSSFYNYVPKVVETIAAPHLEDYTKLAEYFNKNQQIRLINIQHEFGIFGGSDGDYLIPFLQVVRKPVVITLHSVIAKPDEHLKRIVGFMAQKAGQIVVMNELSRELLINEYGIQGEKIAFIPHGIPQTTFEQPDKMKEELGLKDKLVLATFGHLGRGKGIEYAIRAMPCIARRFPNVIYLVLGATHPVVLKNEGEEYRNFLQKEVERLKLKNHVKFYNRYLTIEEIIKYLKACDIYISPLFNQQQSVSGTLSYAMGCGRPVISADTSYARHLVDESTGIIVKGRSANDIARAAMEILSDEKYRKSLSARAYEKTRSMIWPNVAREYFNLYKKHIDLEGREEKKLPPIKLDHLLRMTDDFGIMHHSRYSNPEKRFGYSLDDNARALVVSAKHYILTFSPASAELMKKYLRFIARARRKSGNFANLISYAKKADKSCSQDVQGRTMGALAYVASLDNIPDAERSCAERLFLSSAKTIPRVRALRAIAFLLPGLSFYLKRFPNQKLRKDFIRLADKLAESYKLYSSDEWQWFENQLTYSNSKLPEALFYAYDLTKNKNYLTIANATLGFLEEITFISNHYVPIGQNGWYFKDRRRAYFDQQPEDTAAMVESQITSWRATGKPRHLKDAFTAFEWFLGKNHLRQIVYDEVTGGCHDGLGEHAINLNQGAESTISYHMARLALEEAMSQSAAKKILFS